jgi:hypothetical protein
LLNTLIFEIKGIGGTYGGTAIGLASSIGMLGAFFAPPIGNSLEVFGAGTPFLLGVFICCCCPLLVLRR